MSVKSFFFKWQIYWLFNSLLKLPTKKKQVLHCVPFLNGIYQSLLDSPHKRPVIWTEFPCHYSLQNKCRTADPDWQNLGRASKLCFFIISKFWQNCASIRQVSDLILKTVITYIIWSRVLVVATLSIIRTSQHAKHRDYYTALLDGNWAVTGIWDMTSYWLVWTVCDWSGWDCISHNGLWAHMIKRNSTI